MKPNIQHEVASFQPSSLTKAMALAKIQEQKLQLKHIPPKLYSTYPPILPTPSLNHLQSTTSIPKPISNNHFKMPMTTTSQTKPNFRRLSQSQIQNKREKGLCLYCDEKNTFSHKCKPLAYVLIVPDSKVLNPEELTKVVELVGQ